jgi:hypothetical protein
MVRTITCRAALVAVILASATAALPAKESNVEMLRAGPVTCEFRDGQLRYLYVGDKEIVRRVYFAVRDDQWQTPMPTFSQSQIQKTADTFKVSLAAKCKSEKVDYDWKGEIAGTADGTITFSVTGTPATTFKSNRIGICVLYGVDSLVGQAFEAVGADGKATAGRWPDIVKMDLVAKDYKSIRYKTTDGLGFECSLSPVLFSMEDQRNWGDSSFKSYNTILTGPEAKAGEAASVTATLKVTGAKAAPAAADDVVKVKIGKEIPGAKLPKIITAKDSTKTGDFLDLDSKRPQLKDEAGIQIGYKPSSHLPDDDTFMENRTALEWQLKTLRTLAPKAKVRVDPIRLTDGEDPRAKGPFAASWMLGAIKYLALGGADEACFKLDGGEVAAGLGQAELAGKPILQTTVTCPRRSPIEVLAFYRVNTEPADPVIWIANSTDRPVKITVVNPGYREMTVVRILGQKARYSSGEEVNPDIRIELGAFESCVIVGAPYTR